MVYPFLLPPLSFFDLAAPGPASSFPTALATMTSLLPAALTAAMSKAITVSQAQTPDMFWWVFMIYRNNEAEGLKSGPSRKIHIEKTTDTTQAIVNSVVPFIER